MKPIDRIAKLSKGRVETWDTRNGSSVRIVVRQSNGRFIDNVSQNQIGVKS